MNVLDNGYCQFKHDLLVRLHKFPLPIHDKIHVPGNDILLTCVYPKTFDYYYFEQV